MPASSSKQPERGASGVAPACGSCGSCRKVAHGNHPDFFVIGRLPRKGARRGADDDGPESPETSDAELGAGAGGRPSDGLRPFIVVDQVRAVSEMASMAPREGRLRVFVIDPADRMTTEAQNALLKTLEEPPGRSLLILVASRPHLLLPTVRSRCLTVRFTEMPVDALARAIEARGVAPEDALARAALAGGRPGAALALDLASLRPRREHLLGALERLAAGPGGIADMPALAKDLVGDADDDLLRATDF